MLSESQQHQGEASNDSEDLGIPDPRLTVRVVYEHAGFVVVHKPSGMLSVPGIGPAKQVCVISHVKEMYPWARGSMMVHRLDMETSGLLVVALTAEHQVALSMQFEKRRVRKAYVALLDCSKGEPVHDEGIIDVPMRLDVENRPYQIVDFVQGKDALTKYRVLSREVDRVRVRFEPVTGRTHQLRVHAAAPRWMVKHDGTRVAGGLACPIIGDCLYGTRVGRERLLLHAGEIEFRDPISGARVELYEGAEF
jgi:tRNA pseudouridine32 synthase/23S rRNA pseudouridine746 synthase